ncbi:DUF3164 family protein [Xanthobacter flavus]|uniref:DUF3164 family protein n=1 Tax=Xanthobacter flavus TaxID=281 RepID=UPI00372A6E32
METQTEYVTAPPAGIILIEGNRYMRDADGRLVPEELVSAQDKLKDQTVRKIIEYAEKLSAEIARFRGHTFDDVTTLVDLLAEKYNTKLGGEKGNTTVRSIDGCLKVVVQVQDQLSFGEELQIAKHLVDGCISAWSTDARPEIRALVEHAFNVDQAGKINRSALFALRRLDIDDPQWRDAMKALGDAIQIIGSREYVRFYKRPNPRGRWEAITIDLAAA